MCCVEGERDKYKGLARRLKEERNQFKEMLEAKNNEQAELQVINIRLASLKKNWWIGEDEEEDDEDDDVDSDNYECKTWTKAGQVEMDKMTEMIGELRDD